MVDVLASNDWGGASGVLALDDLVLVLELRRLLLESLLNLSIIVVGDLLVLGWGDLVVMCRGENLLVFHRLYSGVVVVLVLLGVDDCVDLLILSLYLCVFRHRRGSGLLDGGVMVAVEAGDLVDEILRLIHCDYVVG